MAPTTTNGNGNKITLWLLGALFTVAIGAVSAYTGLASSENSQAHERIESRIERLDNLTPRVSALEARTDQAFKSIDNRLGSIERKIDRLANTRYRRDDSRPLR